MSRYSATLWRPPRMLGLIERTRLLSRPHPAVEVVTGPAGVGKTAYALQVAAAGARRTAWVRCAVGTANAADVVALAHRSVGSDFEPSTDDPLVLAGELLALLEEEATVLILDNLHEADHRTVDPLLAETAALLDPMSSIVVTSRSRPTGLIGRIPRFTAVIDSDDLRFDRDEVERLFSQRDRPTTEVDDWLQQTGGWAIALDLASAGAAPTAGDPSTLLAHLVQERAGEAWADVVAFAACPYVNDEVAAAIDIADITTLNETLPVSATPDRTFLPDAVRHAVLRSVAGPEADNAVRRARDAFRSVDPVVALELSVGLGDLDDAAEILNDLVGTISADAAVTWAYHLPPALRHRLPPAVTGGRATVNPDLAELAASDRLEQATTDEERASASFALASVRTAQSQLDDAAELIDTTLELTAEAELRSRALQLQTLVRWWLGDVGGARASLTRDESTPWSGFVDAMVALAENEDDRARSSARRSSEVAVAAGASPTLGMTADSLVHAARGEREQALSLAEQAWSAALEPGGFELGAAGVAVVWLLSLGEDHNGSLARAREVEARVGPRDPFARAGIAMARAHLAAKDPDDGGQAERRLRAIRATGFGSVAAVFERLRNAADREGSGLRVALLGEGEIRVDGRPLDPAGWKSRKAVEIVRYLAFRDGPCRREEVIEAIWPEREPERGRALLRNALSEVRAGLEPGRQAGEPSRFLDTSRTTVQLDATSDLGEAQMASPGDALRLLGQPVAPGIDADWAAEITLTRDRHLADQADRIRRDASHPDRRAALDVLIGLEPWNRAPVDELIALLEKEGDHAGAAAVERRWFEDD